jgi:ubiquinone/menaquinone biosynthesis C-methylase UbiE
MQHGGAAETPAAGGARPPALDWGAGHYESTAEQIRPAARAVVAAAAIGTDERVLDLGCGTGNAALLAAGHTGQVTGVDPALRLSQVARARAASAGKKVEFLPGDAASLPAGDASMDVILSVFAVIFAPDPGAAAREMSRVLAPGGRIVLSAWIPAGAMFEMTSAAADAVRQAAGAPAPEPFAWHDRDALASLLEPYGFSVDVDQHSLAFCASSAQQFLDQETQNHPLAVAGLRILAQLGQAQALRARLLAILQAGNEDPASFRVTSRYVVATARRDS